MSRLRMGRAAVEIVEEMRLVGFWIDNKLNFGGMVSRLAKKARCRIGALRRLQPVLNAENLMTMYKMFIRSIMKYGSVAYLGAAESHLAKLDRVQDSAVKLCGQSVESLGSRREAAAVSMAIKMLVGKARGDLSLFKPKFGCPIALTRKRSRSSYEERGLQMKQTVHHQPPSPV